MEPEHLVPNTIQADGKTLQLNGFGLRIYSIFRVHIYVAGLYVEHLSTDAEAILQSPETKLVTVHFVHNVSAEAARDSWRTGLENNCRAPCQLDPADIARFLAQVPASMGVSTARFPNHNSLARCWPRSSALRRRRQR